VYRRRRIGRELEVILRDAVGGLHPLSSRSRRAADRSGWSTRRGGADQRPVVRRSARNQIVSPGWYSGLSSSVTAPRRVAGEVRGDRGVELLVRRSVTAASSERGEHEAGGASEPPRVLGRVRGGAPPVAQLAEASAAPNRFVKKWTWASALQRAGPPNGLCGDPGAARPAEAGASRSRGESGGSARTEAGARESFRGIRGQRPGCGQRLRPNRPVPLLLAACRRASIARPRSRPRRGWASDRAPRGSGAAPPCRGRACARRGRDRTRALGRADLNTARSSTLRVSARSRACHGRAELRPREHGGVVDVLRVEIARGLELEDRFTRLVALHRSSPRFERFVGAAALSVDTATGVGPVGVRPSCGVRCSPKPGVRWSLNPDGVR